MKQLSRRKKAPKKEKQKPTHLIALLEPIHDLGMHTIVNGWEYRVHGVFVCWRFNHPTKGVVEALPCQIKVLKKITTKKRTSNDGYKAGTRALDLARDSQRNENSKK